MTECGCYNYDEYLGRTEGEGYFHSEDCKYPKLRKALEEWRDHISLITKRDGTYIADDLLLLNKLREILEQT